MNKWLSPKIALVLAFVVLPAFSQAGAVVVKPLIAGQDPDPIGTVTVEEDGTWLYVTYEITEPGWCLVQTHVYVDQVAPTKSAPGKFPFAHGPSDIVSCVLDVYQIALADVGGLPVYVSAHSVVQGVLSGVDFGAISGTACAFFNHNYSLDSPAYFTIELQEAGVLNGFYDGWCVDLSRHIIDDVKYLVDLVPSTDPDAGMWVDRPENLDLINYILNRVDYYFSQGYTYRDIQKAIWNLIDDNPDWSGAYGDPANVAVIEADALANGEGFVPDIGQLLGVLLIPTRADNGEAGQIALIPLVVSGEEETAWATASGPDDIPFDRGWGSYFLFP